MADILRLSGGQSEVTLNATPNSISSASTVRLQSAHSGASLVTQQFANSAANASITIAAGSTTWLRKAPADTLTCNSVAVLASKQDNVRSNG